MIKSTFIFIATTYWIFLPMLVASVPLMARRGPFPCSVVKRYDRKQTGRIFFTKKFFSPLESSTSRKMKLPLANANQWEGTRSYGRLVESKMVNRAYTRTDYKKKRIFYGLPCMCAASMFLLVIKEENKAKRPIPIKRKRLVHEIKAELLKGDVLVRGAAGSGKTCLLKDTIKEIGDDFSAIHWINATDWEAYCNSLWGIAGRMGLEHPAHQSIEDVKAFIQTNGGRKRKLLFVYDHLDQVHSSWVFPVESSKVVITSEDYFWGRDYDYQDVVVHRVKVEEIERFLSEQKFPDLPDTTLKKLANLLLSRSMVTINLVVSYLGKYKPEYEEFCKLLDEEESIDLAIHRLHLEKLKKDAPRLLKSLNILCYLNPNAIAYDFLSDLLDDDGIAELVNLGLLYDNSEYRYSGLDSIAQEGVADAKCGAEKEVSELGGKQGDMLRFYAIDKGLQESIKRYIFSATQPLDDAIRFFNEGWDYQDQNPKTWKRSKRKAGHITRLWEHVKESNNRGLILKMLPIMSSLASYYLYVRYDLALAEKLLKEVGKYAGAPDESKNVLANIDWNLGRVNVRFPKLVLFI